MWQAQATTTKLFGPGNPFKADQIAFVLEAGFNHVANLPAKDWLRFNGDGTDTGGGPDYLSGDILQRNLKSAERGYREVEVIKW